MEENAERVAAPRGGVGEPFFVLPVEPHPGTRNSKRPTHETFPLPRSGRDRARVSTIEKNFRVGREPKDRAIFGFSMGGYLAPTIGLNHPEIFGWVAGASTAGFRGEGTPNKNFKPLEAQLELGKKNFKFIGFTVGTGSDAGGTAGNKGAVDYLTGLGLNVEWSQPPGGMHAWHSWRGYFRDLMADKFFVEHPYATAKVGMTK